MAIQSVYQPPMQSVPTPPTRLDRIMRKVGTWALAYWALVITVILGLIMLAAVSVPVLTYLGLDGLAKPIFFTLHLICAQIPAHSFYLFDHQFGLCARNTGIYGSMFVGGLIFVLSKKRLPGIPWWLWVLLILPMAYDGLTQMVGLRESTWELRLLTGILFGGANMWFALPLIHKMVMETIATPSPVQVQVALPQMPMSISLPVLGKTTSPLPISIPATNLAETEQDEGKHQEKADSPACSLPVE